MKRSKSKTKNIVRTRQSKSVKIKNIQIPPWWDNLGKYYCYDESTISYDVNILDPKKFNKTFGIRFDEPITLVDRNRPNTEALRMLENPDIFNDRAKKNPWLDAVDVSVQLVIRVLQLDCIRGNKNQANDAKRLLRSVGAICFYT